MSSTDKYILILGCFDTKGAIFSYLRDCIMECGEKVLTINTGVMGTTDVFPVDFESDVVALEAETNIYDLRLQLDRGVAMDVMGRGASKIVERLVREGKVKGAIGMGGGGGTYIALSALQYIPIGISKICISTIASKDLSRQIGNKDITLIPSLVDVAGFNGVIKHIIAQAASAICAMSNVTAVDDHSVNGRIAISMFGNTTGCVDRCTKLLEEKGYEVLAFHATGNGGKTMEALIRENCFDAVLDITTTELADELCGGICSAGHERLTAAVQMGLPQVVVPGCMDMVNFGHTDTVPSKYSGREFYSWAPDVTLMRTDHAENIILGKQIALSLNKSCAPVSVVLPLKGISQIDKEGGVFYRPETDQVLFDSIKLNLNENVRLIEADYHINDADFAGLLVNTLLELIEKNKKLSTK